MQAPGSRVVRVFISSTFRDFQEERRLLVNEVFPELRRRARERFVDVIEVDLRWGITQEEAEHGDTLPICLREIDRSRPYFIGLLGERYGWVPERNMFSTAVLEAYPWIETYAGNTSVTEIEMLHGVLNDPKMAGRAFFYFRDPAWARRQGAEFLAASPEHSQQVARLKRRIAQGGVSVVSGYESPNWLSERVLEDLWRRIDADFPLETAPDAWTRESQRHRALMLRNQSFGVPVDKVSNSIDSMIGFVADGSARGPQFLLIAGQPGTGKSAALAFWCEHRMSSETGDLVFAHFVGASRESLDTRVLEARIVEWIRRVTSRSDFFDESHRSSQRSQSAGLPEWLALLSEHIQMDGKRAIIVIDGIDQLDANQPLGWLPVYLPPGVYVIVSASAVNAIEAARSRDRFEIETCLIDQSERRRFVVQYLSRFGRSIDISNLDQLVEHPSAGNLAFLRLLIDELRFSADHETLAASLTRLLAVSSVEALQALRLQRIESLIGRAVVQPLLVAIWASENGLAEPDLLAVTRLAPRTLAALRLQLDSAIIERTDALVIADESLRRAIVDRYVPSEEGVTRTHMWLATYWGSQPSDGRSVSAWVYHVMAARWWDEGFRLLDDHCWSSELVLSVDSERLLRFWEALRAATGFDLSRWLAESLSRWLCGSDADRQRVVLEKLCEHLCVAEMRGALFDEVVHALDIRARSLEQKAQVQMILRQMLWLRGDFCAAAACAERAATMYAEAGFGYGEVVSAKTKAAECYIVGRKFDLALHALQNALTESGRLQPHDDRIRGTVFMRLGDLQTDLGMFREAFQSYTSAWKSLDNVGWRGHLAFRDDLFHSLAILCNRTCHWERGRDFAFQAAYSREERLGRDSLAVAFALNTASTAVCALGEAGFAIRLMQEVSRIAGLKLPKGHPILREVAQNIRVTKARLWAPRLSVVGYPIALVICTYSGAILWGALAGLAIAIAGTCAARVLQRSLSKLTIWTFVVMVTGRIRGRNPIAEIDLPPLPFEAV